MLAMSKFESSLRHVWDDYYVYVGLGSAWAVCVLMPNCSILSTTSAV
jgi:hypothetical protein